MERPVTTLSGRACVGSSNGNVLGILDVLAVSIATKDATTTTHPSSPSKMTNVYVNIVDTSELYRRRFADCTIRVITPGNCAWALICHGVEQRRVSPIATMLPENHLISVFGYHDEVICHEEPKRCG
jgi:hypothetical protein